MGTVCLPVLAVWRHRQVSCTPTCQPAFSGCAKPQPALFLHLLCSHAFSPPPVVLGQACVFAGALPPTPFARRRRLGRWAGAEPCCKRPAQGRPSRVVYRPGISDVARRWSIFIASACLPDSAVCLRPSNLHSAFIVFNTPVLLLASSLMRLGCRRWCLVAPHTCNRGAKHYTLLVHSLPSA